eukprot:s1146_g10.t1
MLKALEGQRTALGRFRRKLEQHAVAQREPAVPSEALPVSLEAVRRLLGVNEDIRDWLTLMCWIFNYQYCGNLKTPKAYRHSAVLSEKQKEMIMSHLGPALVRLVAGDPKVPDAKVLEKELSKKGQDYDGTTFVVMEELRADDVIECWPTADQAADAPLEDFLEGETRRLIMSPMESILPEVEWPARLPQSYVRATDETWEKLVTEGLSATDASPTGAGSCLAEKLKRRPRQPDPQYIICANCRQEMAELIGSGEEFECPLGCGARFCSIQCFHVHRAFCDNQSKQLPLFSERWSGGNAPLSQAVLKAGINICLPYVIKLGSDMVFFTEEGKDTRNALDAFEIDAEHHAPVCKSMSRARGKPFYIDGVRHEGPPALRDEYYVMGYRNLRRYNAVLVRHGNKMALKSVARCKDLDDEGKDFSLEHPYRSWFWYMKATVELASQPHVRLAVFSNRCFGGGREKWTAVLTNCEAIYDALHTPECPHDMQVDYQPYYDDWDRVQFPTEQEAEYPTGLAETYAQALYVHFQVQGLFPNEEEFRVQHLMLELRKYSRFQDPELKLKVAMRIYHLEKPLTTGRESEALHNLLKYGHYRGTDVRLAVEHNSAREPVPYPAYRWLWRKTLAFMWRQDAHFNELEGLALVAHLRRLLKEKDVKKMRLMIVVDSQVLFYAIVKGRDPSMRINRLLKKLMALQLFCDVYVFPVWTLSYKAALKNFFDWLDDEDLPLPSTSRQLDESLAAFLEHLWLDDISITYAGHTLSALRRFYPQLRCKLPVARQFFSNWKSVHTPKQAVPMPASVALALAGVAFSVSEVSLGFLILLGFLAFLRTGEITSLTANRIQAYPETEQIILALPATKTSKQKLESVQVEDMNLAILA